MTWKIPASDRLAAENCRLRALEGEHCPSDGLSPYLSLHLWSHALPQGWGHSGATGPQKGSRLPLPAVGSAVHGHQATGRGASEKDGHPSLDWWSGRVLVVFMVLKAVYYSPSALSLLFPNNHLWTTEILQGLLNSSIEVFSCHPYTQSHFPYILYLFLNVGFQSSAVVKNLPANAGDTCSIPGLRRCPGEGNGNSKILAWKISWTEESHKFE